MVSLMNRFFFSSWPRLWFLNTTSSFHFRLICALPAPASSGFPLSAAALISSSFRRAASAFSSSSCFRRASSRSWYVWPSGI